LRFIRRLALPRERLDAACVPLGLFGWWRIDVWYALWFVRRAVHGCDTQQLVQRFVYKHAFTGCCRVFTVLAAFNASTLMTVHIVQHAAVALSKRGWFTFLPGYVSRLPAA
jgi:hypothetical protein